MSEESGNNSNNYDSFSGLSSGQNLPPTFGSLKHHSRLYGLSTVTCLFIHGRCGLKPIGYLLSLP